ncbi:MAG: cation:proton antiporter [Acholeplasmataceae bacterium]|nr:cation:proton antiporter [Acholeplasmataceae bacterium]
MLLSVALIILLSLILAQVFEKLKLPRMIGMLCAGILLGPYVLDLIDGSILNISAELRQFSLIVILIRAGLSLDLNDLKKIGRPALLLSFVPALFEFIVIMLFGPMFFDITLLEAAIIGSMVAAVSPAIIVPRMIKLMERGYGKKKPIPQLILAGASIDDVFVIILFSSLIQSYQTNSFSIQDLLFIPISLILGIGLGALMGFILLKLFKKFHMRDTIKVLLIFSTGFLLVSLENYLKDIVLISGLVSVMVLGGTILNQYEILAHRLVHKFEKIWVVAEIMLFVLVGAVLDIRVIPSVGLFAIILVLLGLIGRMLGVMSSLIKTPFKQKEKLFVGISYIPKATVQAAIGAIPLSLGFVHGQLMLSIAVLSIVITAPIGAFLMDLSYTKLLERPIIDAKLMDS